MSDIQQLARRVLRTEMQVLVEAEQRLGDEFESAVRLVHSRGPPGRLVVAGAGKSGHVGNKIAATLASAGTPSFFIHPTEAAHGDFGMVMLGDVVLAISYSCSGARPCRVPAWTHRYARR